MTPAVPAALWLAGVRDALLRHYDAHARTLPWRGTADPYAVWVSEIMLQQTRVDAVLPYYERWVRRFPDIDTLAGAPLDDVLTAWAGLGYYARARNLHSAARIVREQHHSIVPADYETLRSLPGVGEYTAGAVSSIAYGVRRPAIDGNVRRLLARLLDDPAPTAARLRACADALLPADRPGDFNQALMDFGATICTPRAPRCAACPLATHCAAFVAGSQLERPRPRPRATPPLFLLATAVIIDARGRALLVQRPAHGLLARMWCLPAREVASEQLGADAAADLARSLLGDVDGAEGTSSDGADGNSIDSAKGVSIGSVDHMFSHRRERYLCYRFNPGRSCVTPANAQWVVPSARTVAIPRAQRRILSLLSGQPHS